VIGTRSFDALDATSRVAASCVVASVVASCVGVSRVAEERA